jgi:hypothetical protein
MAPCAILYLNVLAEMGIVGFGVVMIAFVAALYRAWRHARADSDVLDRAWSVGVLGGLATLLIYGVADSVLVSAQVVGLICGLVGLLGYSPSREATSLPPDASASDPPRQARSGSRNSARDLSATPPRRFQFSRAFSWSLEVDQDMLYRQCNHLVYIAGRWSVSLLCLAKGNADPSTSPGMIKSSDLPRTFGLSRAVGAGKETL